MKSQYKNFIKNKSENIITGILDDAIITMTLTHSVLMKQDTVFALIAINFYSLGKKNPFS